ncbi:MULTISPECIES: hypothetical protein [Photorhabdus]|uniref:Uncharacterized protein n=2 Tax=Photorhabdus asymbiotica TaxID=291112 RepID=C7BJT6_PHOAA|nr:hypothetical protein [Photorhabdus asymbiotica]RKS58063.1 hypothetical protein BDD30_2897 [Photorhabdus asymbiotica]CAQ82602.1 conserved hypothetical protein [Photorhabdus asymbiotica]
MIKLTQGQFDKIIELEKQEFVEKMEKEILAEYANLIPCNSHLSKRLKGAYDYLLALNFQEKNAIRAYLYLVAFNPDFQNASPIKDVFESSGQNLEQQFKDFLRIAKNRMNRRH